MKIDVSADHTISGMFRSGEIRARCAAQAPGERASRVGPSGRMTRTHEDVLQISSSNQSSPSSFAEELTQGISKSDRTNPFVPQDKDPNTAVRSQPEDSLKSNAGTSEEVSTAEEVGIKARIVSTPIGVFDLNSKGPNQYTCLTGISEMRAYFMTHQPADWMYSDRARAEFAKIYGEKALVTLDWDGTVPENVDSIWVTKRPIGPDGRPLPANRTSSTLT